MARTQIKFIDVEKFKGVNVKLDYENIVKKYADKAVKQLKSISPVSNKHPKNRKKYRTTWTTRETDKKNDFESMVFNEKNWQLTHLLEEGHLIVNKRGGVGWASMKPHIKPTFDKLRPQFIKAMQKVEIEANFK